jgi:hypothetical protein
MHAFENENSPVVITRSFQTNLFPRQNGNASGLAQPSREIE